MDQINADVMKISKWCSGQHCGLTVRRSTLCLDLSSPSVGVAALRVLWLLPQSKDIKKRQWDL